MTTGTDDGNGIEREGFAVSVRVAHEDMEPAEALGWSGGLVPDVEVILARETVEGRIADSTVATTDATGRAEFGELIPAVYRVTALRLLEAAEVAAVDGAFPTLRAFGGGDKVQVAPALPSEFELELQGNRTGGLVISEWSFTTTVLGQEGFGYVFGGYLEVYNNSDQSLFLDGASVALGYDIGAKDFACCPCMTTRPAANDPEGVWAHWFQRFPGSGGQFPLGPGETAVVATDARDHRQVAEVFLDLRGADFEFMGSSDVDNPDVPNMVDNGLSEWFNGHGLWSSGRDVPTLVGEVDIESLPRSPIHPTDDRPWVRFPATEILDVYSADSETFPSREISFCRQVVHDNFDRLDLVLPQDFSEPPGPRMSQQRRVVGTAPVGWPILLDTNASAVDFVTTERTAGALPPQQ